MNFKGLALRLSRLPKEDYLVFTYPHSGYIHIYERSSKTWIEPRQDGSLCTVVVYLTEEDFLKRQNTKTLYRADGWYWPALVSALGLPVSAEAPKLAG